MKDYEVKIQADISLVITAEDEEQAKKLAYKLLIIDFQDVEEGLPGVLGAASHTEVIDVQVIEEDDDDYW